MNIIVESLSMAGLSYRCHNPFYLANNDSFKRTKHRNYLHCFASVSEFSK